MRGKRKISFVVPAFNEEKWLPSCLASIGKAAEVFVEGGWEWEVIVCDNNSSDGTAQVAREAGACVVFEGENQIARARNRGASAAGGDWLVFVDADSLVSRELLEDLRQAIGGGQVIGGGCCLACRGGSNIKMRWMLRIWNRISCFFRWAPGSFLFCRRDVFERLGGFSLRYFAAEDVDLGRRMKREARREGKSVIILAKHPLLTSARKLELYSFAEFIITLVRLTFGHWWMVRSRKACFYWYDGRR